MLDYKKLYLLLFDAISDSRRAMEEMNFGQAAQILARAQNLAEGEYFKDAEKQAE